MTETIEQNINDSEKEFRLFDGQWMNIVNRANCYAGYTMEDAIHTAVRLTEEKMAQNIRSGEWPTVCK